MPTRSPATRRSDILLAAERLFAEHGFHGVTLRQIAAAADVPLALVGYHYGQKHELFEAIFDRWHGTIEERLAGLKAARAAPRDERLARVVQAFVEPVLRLRASPDGECYARLVARELSHARDDTDRVLRRHFDPLARATIDALLALRPAATRAQAAWCYQFMLGALLHHLSDTRVQRLSDGQAVPGDAQAAPLLQAFMLAGIDAVLPLRKTASPSRRPRP